MDLYEKFLGCSGVSTDSRTIKGGEMFFALRGENFDGNAYAEGALRDGAAYAVVEKGSAAAALSDSRIIAVDDTLSSLSSLARTHRESLSVDGKRLPVVGLTGTNGKTTTKELIRCVLERKLSVSATKGNLNNDIGVPLTLLGIGHSAQIAVVEMGASHPDDIEKLVKVCEPDYGLITNVGKAHLLGFGSFEGVKKAKGALYDWISGKGGVVFVNADDPVLCEMASSRNLSGIVPYGLKHWGCEILPCDGEHPFLRISIPREISDSSAEGALVASTNLVGSYNAPNVLAAIAIGLYFGVSLDDAVDAVSSYVPSNNRSQMTRTERNTLIVDAYNANPTSMAAALENFSMVQAPVKIALLGDMRELGEDSVREHEAIVAKTGEFGRVCLVGEEFRKALSSMEKPSNVEWYPSSEALFEKLSKENISGATILVKGSRGIMMEKVIPAL